MNAQSTPVRKVHLRSQSRDSFSEITPIKKAKTLEKQISNSSINLVCKSKKEKFCSGLFKTQYQRAGKQNKNLEGNGSVNEKFGSDIIIGDTFDSAGWKSNLSKDTHNSFENNLHCDIKDLFSETFSTDTGCFLSDEQLSESKLVKVIDSKKKSSEDSKVKLCDAESNSPIHKVQKLNSECMKSEEAEAKNNEILTASDVMKWNDQSFFPKNNGSNLSSQIKIKLLGNVENYDGIKSQGTGWTQFNSSGILKLIDQNTSYQECGPFYGLPLLVQKLYEEHKDIKQLYAWQEECLNLEAIKERQNLVYALPTSGGKTLVAELLILREILCYKRNVLFILPYVSIVQEKIKDFSQFALELGFLVEEYAAGKGVIPPKKRRRKNSVIIATFEKALVVVNSLIENKRLNEFGMIVVDELHMLSEEGRGATLESILTQIIYCGEKIQIIGMTATIGNLEEVAKFLKAESYVGNFRPVSLNEYIKCDRTIYSIDWSSEEGVKEYKTLRPITQGGDPDGIAELVQEVIPKDSVLIFCPTRKNCENVALLLSRTLSRNLLKIKEEEKKSLFRALASESNDQICPILRKTLPFGVAYHHSGLTAGERKLLEESFRDRTLTVICCTSTLAVGVNLPAKRVILRSPYVGKDFISLSKYKQMIGRAGRSGFGSEGESFLMCQFSDLEKVKILLKSPMDRTISKVDLETCKNLVLSSIGLGTANTRKTLKELLQCSLLHVQASQLNADTKKMTDACITTLYKQGALKIKDSLLADNENSISKLDVSAANSKKSLKISNNSPLTISRLGRAAMKGGLSLEKAHELYSDLIKAQSSLVLLTNLHLLYLVTPPEMVSQIKPNFSLYFNAYMQLNANELHTAKIIGVTEFAMSKLAMGIQPKTVPETIVNRFYVSLMLNELWKQQTLWNVAALFEIPRGVIQTLMTSASTFANSVLRFCEELEEFWSFKSLLTDFTPRLAHCCSAELLPLMDLPAVKRGRAKQLYDAGFKTLQILANSKPGDLVHSVDHISLKVATQIVAAANLLLMEKAESLKEEAEDVLEGLAEKSGPKGI